MLKLAHVLPPRTGQLEGELWELPQFPHNHVALPPPYQVSALTLYLLAFLSPWWS